MEIGRIPVRPETPIATNTRIRTFFFMASTSHNRSARKAGRPRHDTKYRRSKMPSIVGILSSYHVNRQLSCYRNAEQPDPSNGSDSSHRAHRSRVPASHDLKPDDFSAALQARAAAEMKIARRDITFSAFDKPVLTAMAAGKCSMSLMRAWVWYEHQVYPQGQG